ncbi:hypothetical protein LDG_6045 [Legionella drancourtii LLAP12]|uniref:Uncharacterized protein n=1 Tax=Legionella drancourtii LLAP12 TaxID=658187 RepID=G9ELP4_9GAMM|nr:hypothetical protein LDG_6045 [Legionella drancourtii LLAP12]
MLLMLIFAAWICSHNYKNLLAVFFLLRLGFNLSFKLIYGQDEFVL